MHLRPAKGIIHACSGFGVDVRHAVIVPKDLCFGGLGKSNLALTEDQQQNDEDSFHCE